MSVRGYSLYSKSTVLNYKKLVVLGPKRTSSYYCASQFKKKGLIDFESIIPKNSFVDVYDYLSLNKDAIGLIPNAWKDINKFYINNHLEILASFICDTKPYSLAGYKDNISNYKGKLKVSSHPAPVEMINKYIPEGIDYEIIIVDSREKAAELVRNKEVDICLSNELAIREHGLNILSEPFIITMLWSVFKNKEFKGVKE